MDKTAKPKVLYVEDDLGLAMIYKLRLENEGLEVRHCDRGDMALQMGREFKPDLILLDLMMPQMSGFETLELFRNTPETSNAKIIIMSALSQPEDIKKTKDLGADDYLVKSQVTINDILGRVRQHLGMDSSDTLNGDRPTATP